jgi:hypothetical protein
MRVIVGTKTYDLPHDDNVFAFVQDVTRRLWYLRDQVTSLGYTPVDPPNAGPMTLHDIEQVMKSK